MRNVMLLAAILIVGLLAASASAADLSPATLQLMGLEGMQTVSDAQGDQIRGKFYRPTPSFNFEQNSVANFESWACGKLTKAGATGSQCFDTNCCPSSLDASTKATATKFGASSCTSLSFRR